MQQALLAVIDFGNRLGVCGYWVTLWIYRAVLVALLGGFVGLVSTPLLKLLFFSDRDWMVLAKQAFTIGFQYFGIWAGGVSLVWIVMDRKRAMRGLALLFPRSSALS
jgi:hypothetical protein